MFYDVRFDAIAPKSADSTEQEEVIRLIINVEAQTKFKPGWRAFGFLKESSMSFRFCTPIRSGLR